MALFLLALTALSHPIDAAPRVFAPGVISSGAADAALTLSPDGREAFFERNNGQRYAIMTSHLTHSGWSMPRIASFSGRWLDLESAIAADGSYLIFSSNRPEAAGGAPIDGHYYGKVQPAKGGALWRVDRKGRGWSTPRRLPDEVNFSSSIYEPSLAANGDLYFQAADPNGKQFHLYVARARGRGYDAAARVDLHGPADSSDMDPAIAPDGSFLIFASDRSGGKDHQLLIAFRQPNGWTVPEPLGSEINTGSVGDPRIDLEHSRLYFASRRVAPNTADAQRDLDSAARWNNGLTNIWYAPFDPAPWRSRAIAVRRTPR